MSGPSWEDPRRVLQRHGLRPSRGYSQNFLVHRPTVDRIAAATRGAETIVELGPGLGTLTGALLRRGARVVAVERDPKMVAVLREELGQQAALEIVEGDATTCNVSALAAPPVTVAGNLPYAVTGAILRNLIGQRSSLARAIIMVQKEVQGRLVADPGTKTYGALTIFTRAAFEPRRLFDVSAGCFYPAPKVASAVVELSPRPDPIAETEMFRRVVRASFEARRKTLTNALSQGLPSLGREAIQSALAEAGLDGSRRGETYGEQDFARLAARLEEVVSS